MNILVSGGAGYIGSVLCQLLMNKGHRVRVLDKLMYGGESIAGFCNYELFEYIKGDICNESDIVPAMAGIDAVVHLAAIVGDPNCAARPDFAVQTNVEGSKLLYQVANDHAVKRFLSSSTCSNYGRMSASDSYVDENSELKPVSLYAETKVEMEKFLLAQDRNAICQPVCLRFGTAHGLSPSMRFDLTVNHFTKDLALGRKLEVFGEQFWRPYCHIYDISRAIIAVLEASAEKVAFEVFNIGATEENYTKGMIVKEIQKLIPDAKIKYVAKQEDPRDYRVNFDKIREILGFKLEKSVPFTIHQVKQAVEDGIFKNPDAAEFNIGQG